MKRAWRLNAQALGLSAGIMAAAMSLGVAGEDKSALTAPQKDEVRKLVHDYIMEHPEIIMEAVNALQARDEKEKADKQTAAVRDRKKEIFDAADGTVLGNPKGDVTLVEFFDYNCGYCKGMYPTMMETLKDDGKVRLILKEFPILGPPSTTASRAALAARKQNKYAELHMALMSHKASLTDDSIMQIAKQTGLDVDKLKKDMADPAVDAIIKKNHALAADLNIEGTPAMVVGETLIGGAVSSKAKLADLIKTARK